MRKTNTPQKTQKKKKKKQTQRGWGGTINSMSHLSKMGINGEKELTFMWEDQ